MSKFIHLFLGHLVGDYVFQNSWIARGKSKRLNVLIIHIGIIFLSQLVVILGLDFNRKTLIAVSLVALMHLFIDLFKFYFRRKKFSRTTYYYIFDQSLHVLSLLIVLPVFKQSNFFIPDKIAAVISVAIFNAYLLGIFTHFLNGGGIYKRDLYGYFFRAIAPLFYVFGGLSYGIYIIVSGVLAIYTFKKHQVLSWTLSAIFTVILLEVML
ncbi:DUF3307 domain-containing protein [Thermosipho ferrireducens]|uniref:DUF3307 domain-containing protein n=1 Tax=Thermosipho ferrireducens TaxID=2571116 RepID=A0ABX7S9X0_9BACT|nr:DUF3307 domain-containing protein [Thermosipho ferrireducens]QTA38191.1 DUF3307 domain-containing protein [Thermosipho ferrireducens]